MKACSWGLEESTAFELSESSRGQWSAGIPKNPWFHLRWLSQTHRMVCLSVQVILWCLIAIQLVTIPTFWYQLCGWRKVICILDSSFKLLASFCSHHPYTLKTKVHYAHNTFHRILPRVARCCSTSYQKVEVQFLKKCSKAVMLSCTLKWVSRWSDLPSV